MGVRRRSREYALKVLYETEFHSQEPKDIIGRISQEEGITDELMDFLQALTKAFFENQSEVDSLIEGCSDHWKLKRMALVDRNLLRLGLTELKYMSDIPKNVTINEYLEIAKKYGTEDSSGFINGILDKFEKS